MIVWHHRRSGFLAHLKQVGAYGLHRGFFAKKYPETSFKLKYFIPSIFVLFFIVSVFYPFLPNLVQNATIFGWVIYIVSLIVGVFEISIREKNLVAIASLLFIFPTHIYYGANFIFGYFFKEKIVSPLR